MQTLGFTAAVIAATAQAALDLCTNTAISVDSRTWQAVNNTIYHSYDLIEAENRKIVGANDNYNTCLEEFYSLTGDRLSILEEYFATAEDKDLDNQATQNDATADNILIEIDDLLEQRWQEVKELRNKEEAIFYEQSLVAQLAALKTSYDTAMNDASVTDKKGTVEAGLRTIQSQADTDRTNLLAAKDQAYSDWINVNNTLANLYQEKEAKEEAFTTAPVEEQEARRTEFDTASNNYNEALTNANNKWSDYLNAWNPWATADALYQDTVWMLSPVITDQFQYNTDYAAYPAQVQSAVQNGYVLPTYLLDNYNTQFKSLQDAYVAGVQADIDTAVANFKTWAKDEEPSYFKQMIKELSAVSSGAAATISSIQEAHNAGTKTAWQTREWNRANDFQQFSAQKSNFDATIQALIDEQRAISQQNYDDAVTAAREQYALDVAVLNNNVVTTKNTLDIDGTQDIAAKLNALHAAQDNAALYSDVVTVRTRLTRELIAAQADQNAGIDRLADLARLDEEINDWSDSKWALDEIANYALDVSTAEFELAAAQQFEYESNIDWNEARLELLSRTDESGLIALQTELTDALEATLPELEDACTHETEIRDRIQVRFDEVNNRLSTLQAAWLEAEISYNNLNAQACVVTFFYEERLEYFSDEQDRLRALENDLQKLLDGDVNVVLDSHNGYGLTTGLTDLLSTANANRTAVCDRVDEVNRVIAIYESYYYDGGEQAVVDFFTISYDNWGSIETWSSYNPNLSAFDPSCAETEPEYASKVTELLVDPYSADKRATFTACTGVPVPAPAFPNQISYYQTQAASDVTVDQDALSNSEQLITDLSSQIDAKIAEELRLRRLANDQRVEYAIRVTAAHLKAESCPPLLNPIAGFEAEISRLNQVIVDETVVLATKWESYWTDLKNNATSTLQPLENAFNSAFDALAQASDFSYTLLTIDAASTPLRRLGAGDPIDKVSDEDMILELGPNDVPVAMQVCENGAFQVFYGAFGDVASAKAGPAHGSLTNCEFFEFDSRVSSIQLNKVNGDNDYLYSGVQIETQSGQSFTFGNMDTSADFNGNMPESIFFTAGANSQFWGFSTDVDTVDLAPVQIEVLSYDSVKYVTDKTTLETNFALIEAQQELIDTADDGLNEWQNIAYYQKVIESDLTTNKPKPTPKNINVVRPEQVAAAQAAIDEQIAEIEAEKALTAKHRENAKAIADAQAASDAEAVKNAFKGYHDGKIATLEASHRAEMSDQRTYYRSNIITLLGLDAEEANDCDDECLELVGIKQVALNYEEHSNHDENRNTGALVAVIIGGILLLVLLICLMMRMQKNKAEAGSVALNTNSYRSDNNV